MSAADRSVLHVLPHPGGGGDTYVEVLDEMPGYRFGRVYLADAAKPAPGRIASGIGAALRRTWSHDLLHVHGEVAGGLFLPLLAARPSVVTLHGLHLARRLDGAAGRAAALNLRAVLRAADRTICVSRAEHDALAAIAGSAAARAVVVHNGAGAPEPMPDAARDELRRELGVTGAEPVAIWVGSLDERRDPVVAVHAANAACVRLLVVGDGSLRPQVEEAAGPLVQLLGHRRDVSRLLHAADFYVLVSRREGFAFGLLEALAHGLPAVVTDLPENVEAIGDAGIAVPWGDAEGLADVLRRLAGASETRAVLGRTARTRILESFSRTKMVERTRAVYEDVLRPPPP